jgi:hypothetical protein
LVAHLLPRQCTTFFHFRLFQSSVNHLFNHVCLVKLFYTYCSINILLGQLSGFESKHLPKIQNGRHKQKSGQHTLARLKSIKKRFRVSHKMVLFTAHILAQNTPTTLLVNLSILLQLCVRRCYLLCLTRMGIKLCNSPPLPPLFLVVCTAMQMVFAWFADGSVCAKFQQCRPQREGEN